MFRYKGIKESQQVEGEIRAVTIEQAEQFCRENGILPLDLQRVSTRKTRKANLPSKWLAAMFSQMAIMVKSNVPLQEMLGTLVVVYAGTRYEKIIISISDSLNTGRSLSEAMEATGMFSQFIVHTIHAGEESGKMYEAMRSISDLLKRDADLWGKLKEAAIYPLVILLVAAVVMVIIGVYIMPNIESLYETSGAKLPPVTSFTLGAMTIVGDYWWLGGISLLVAAFYWKVVWPVFSRSFAFELVFHIPAVGDLIDRVDTEMLARSLGFMISSNVTIPAALGVAAKSSIRPSRRHGLLNAVREVHEGHSLADSLRKSGAFPPMFCTMLTVGETSGNVGGVLHQVAAAYEENVQGSLGRVVALIEPVAIMLTGSVIGFIIISLMLPILSMGEIVKVGTILPVLRFRHGVLGRSHARHGIKSHTEATA